DGVQALRTVLLIFLVPVLVKINCVWTSSPSRTEVSPARRARTFAGDAPRAMSAVITATSSAVAINTAHQFAAIATASTLIAASSPARQVRTMINYREW